MKTNKKLLSLAIVSGLITPSTMVNAAGFQLAEYSATGLGRAYAGEAAIADNASTQWRNPAMLTYLEGTQISTGAIYVNPNIDLTGQVDGAKSANPRMGQTPANAHDFADAAVIPNLYISHRYSDALAFGFALGTNYGMETNLGSDFAASHFGNEASVKTMEANLNLGYKLTPEWSLGGGLRYVQGEGSFGASAPTKNIAQNPLTGAVFTLPQGTKLKYMEGDDNAFGWQVGTAWQISSDHRLGFTYKSEVKLKLEGYATGVGFGLFNNQRDNGSMDLALPATAELASYHQINDKLALHTSVNWTDWSSFEKLEAQLNTKGSQTVKEEHWKDNYRFAIGATYQLDPKLALRSGLAYDTSAVDDKNRTTTIPETDRTWLSLGASYEVTKKFTLDAGLTYIIAKDASIKESRGYASDDTAQALGGEFTGEVSGNIWLVGLQANYTF